LAESIDLSRQAQIAAKDLMRSPATRPVAAAE
jgi:hypothetical protein